MNRDLYAEIVKVYESTDEIESTAMEIRRWKMDEIRKLTANIKATKTSGEDREKIWYMMIMSCDMCQHIA